MAKIMKFAKTAIKNLFLPPVTTSYPEKPAEYGERTRGHIEIDFELCTLCGLCSKMCPPRAIEVDKRSGNWSINNFDCIQCGYCAEKCVKKCLKIVPGYTAPDYEKKVTSFHKEVEKKYPVYDPGVCVYCTLCDKKCPVQAIRVDRAAKTWKLDINKCISCGLCERNCPKKCIKFETKTI